MTVTRTTIKTLTLKLFRLIRYTQRPYGLVSWRYLLPMQEVRIQLHRTFWWLEATRRIGPLGLPFQLWLYLRWVLWAAWGQSWRVVKRCGPEVSRIEGISLVTQLLTTLKLSLGWCVPPVDVYRFRLYRAPETMLDYVYDLETQSYHAWQRQQLGLPEASAALALLQDKIALERTLSGLDLPVVATAQIVSRGNLVTLQCLISPMNRVFCKTRSGNRGLGAFAAWETSGGLSGQAFSGQALIDTGAVEQMWRTLLTLDDALIQPLLLNHPLLATMVEGEEVITVRYISEYKESAYRCLSATLEVPAGKHHKTRQTTYLIWPIEPISGVIQAWPKALPLTAEMTARRDAIVERMPAENRVPDWNNLVKWSHLAHQQFPELATIAWDWVITPTGACLLEGNSGWGPATPQQLKGGFLKKQPKNTLN